MPQTEREKLLGEIAKEMEKIDKEDAEMRALGKKLYDSYVKHFPLPRSKAKAILSGKTGNQMVKKIKMKLISLIKGLYIAVSCGILHAVQTFTCCCVFQPFVIHDMKSLMAGQQFINCKQLPHEDPEMNMVMEPMTGELELSLFRRVSSRSAENIREITEFAKAIPGFLDLDLNDQITLLKYAAMEVLILLWSPLMNKDGTLIAYGQIFMTREFLRSLREPFCEILEPKFDFAIKFNTLDLDDSDLALFIAVIILCGGNYEG